MQESGAYPVLIPTLQIGFLSRFKEAESRVLHPALVKAMESIRISDLDQALLRFAGEDGLQILARYSLRGELIFATPDILVADPLLLAYYRLLLGFSQKEFFFKGPFGRFKTMEENGKISEIQKNNLDNLCYSLSESAKLLLKGLVKISRQDIQTLQTLTLGSQFRGTRNNIIGQEASIRVFKLLKEVVKDYND